MASPSTSSVPPTLLPTDPTALARYLRSQQLASLRGLYEHKVLTVSQQFEERAASLRGRHGRARRRRGSSPFEPERDLEAEEEEDDLEIRKRLRYDPSDDEEGEQERHENVTVEGPAVEGANKPATPPAKKPRRPRQHDETAVDPAHTYDLVFDLAPDHSADAYYHGPHPPPPARIVRSILRASRKKPFVDPEGLSSAQLEALTSRLWEEEGKGLSIFFGEDAAKKRAAGEGLSRDQERYQRELHAEAADEWEASVIAGFSAACDEKIGRTLARKPMTAHEMQAQVAAQAQAAQQQAQQQQPQAAHPAAAVSGYGATAQLSPYGERQPFATQQQAPYWR
ncbi:hypothetical protein JCM8097_004807 [Rhodosporidiobolus ruineniae]